VVIKTKLGLSSKGDVTRAGSCQVTRSNKWFSLLDCEVNDKGEIVYKFATDSTKKTPDGRVVQIGVFCGEQTDDFEPLQSTSTNFYQLT